MLLKPLRTDKLFSFKIYFIRIAKLYICTYNVINMNAKYSHCGSIHFKRIKNTSLSENNATRADLNSRAFMTFIILNNHFVQLSFILIDIIAY